LKKGRSPKGEEKLEGKYELLNFVKDNAIRETYKKKK